MSVEIQKITADQVRFLADKHVRMYAARIEAGKRGSKQVNIADCERYLAIWRSIAEKGMGPKLTQEELHELWDAVESGELDDYKPSN